MSTKKSRLKRKPVIAFTYDDEEANEDVQKAAKIKAPIVWSHLPPGFVIQDLQEPLFEAALDLIKEEYFTNDALCRQVNLAADPESVEEYLRQTHTHLLDKCSICAVHEASNTLAGVLILRILHQSDFGKVFSRIKLHSGEAYAKILRVKSYLNRKTDIFELFSCDKFLRFYLQSVRAKYKKSSDIAVSLSLVRAAMNVARSVNVPVVMTITSTKQMQMAAERLGMEVIQEVYYVDWLEDGEMVFDDPGPGNYTISLMAGRVPSLN